MIYDETTLDRFISRARKINKILLNPNKMKWCEYENCCFKLIDDLAKEKKSSEKNEISR
jgi:hypothetical protein